MHIPDSMLQGSICPVTAAVAAAGLATSTYFCAKTKTQPDAARFAAVTALIFAGQMLNFPISNGTSGHLLGGVLAASLLGTPFGVLSIALVVSIQALIFSDGGLTVLGANLVNMALVGAGIGGFLHSRLQRRCPSGIVRHCATALAAWMSIVSAAILVSVELAFSGQIALVKVFPAMLATHAVIGIGEAALTVVACALFAKQLAVGETVRHPYVTSTAMLLFALVLSPFASPLPDGLEWVAQRYGFLYETAPAFVGLFEDYALPALENPIFSTMLAGLCGVSIAFGTAWLLARALLLLARKLVSGLRAV